VQEIRRSRRAAGLAVCPAKGYLGAISGGARAPDINVIREGLALAPAPFSLVVVPGAILRRDSRALSPLVTRDGVMTEVRPGDDDTVDWLIRECLERVGGGGPGCDTLLLDHRDGRLCELTFPGGGPQGGGVPRLAWISLQNARAKYGAEGLGAAGGVTGPERSSHLMQQVLGEKRPGHE